MVNFGRFTDIFPRIAAFCGAVLLALTGASGYYAHSLPDRIYTRADGVSAETALLPLSLHPENGADSHAAELRLFGMIPVKRVSVVPLEQTEVCLGGEPFGIRMLMAGAMVVSLGSVKTAAGEVTPAADSGITVGDILQTINGKPVTGSRDLQEAVAESAGKPVQVTLLRGDSQLAVQVQPAYASLLNRWQTGMWVRDSTAGIGTVTYYTAGENDSVQFAGLGHPVCDADTGGSIPLASGDVAAVDVTEVTKGTAGKPGALHGRFDRSADTGTLLANTACGVFGEMTHLPDKQIMLPLGLSQEIRRGEAEIWSTLKGTSPQRYTVEIEEIRRNDPSMRDLVIHVTDERLLEAAGGIVQGMSGSPIVQDGRLVGAVTHVFVKDPTRGYGIFAENMYAESTEPLLAA